MKSTKTQHREGPPKPPRRDCRRAKTWGRYYEAMAAWFTASAEIIELTMPGSFPVIRCRAEAARFMDGAKEIADRTHPNILSGEWT